MSTPDPARPDRPPARSRRCVVHGGSVVTPDGVVADGAIAIVDGVVDAIVTSSERPPMEDGVDVVDAGGGWIVPGFVDAQINGGAGIDLTREPERAIEFGRSLVAHGVTAFLPTMITAAADRRAAAMVAAMRWGEPGADADERIGAMPLGWHFEGPVISPERRGAHPVEPIVGAAAVRDEGWSAGTGVAMVTLAPEIPGAEALIRELVARGVVVALGHTDADADTARAAVAAGASVVTHLFNAMRPFGHRDPGVVGLALGSDELVAGLIVDGVHVDPLAVSAAWRSLGPARTMLVTDAVAARGAPTHRGTEHLGDVRIVEDVGSGGAVRTIEGVLAGSLLTLDAAVRRLIDITGADVPDAVATVTSTPARVLGLHDRGVLRRGARGDVTILDRTLAVRAVVIGGVVAWSDDEALPGGVSSVVRHV